jgi:hypothetical protein
LAEIEIRFQFQAFEINPGRGKWSSVRNGLDESGEQGNGEFVVASDRIAFSRSVFCWTPDHVGQGTV